MANSSKLLQLLYQDWIPAFAGMTGPGNIVPVFSLAVIPAKAGIQTKQSTISNNVYCLRTIMLMHTITNMRIKTKTISISA